jgi:hypothetical protein
MNKQIETTELEISELTPQQIDAVSGAGEIGDAVGYFIGAAAAGVLYFAEKYGSKLITGK